jgi:hypothetical protein
VPSAPALTCARIVTPPRGTTPCARISAASPISIAPSSKPSVISVRWAVRTPGLRNAGTPLEIASTPVTAEQPAANAFSSSRTLSVVVAEIGPRSVPMCGVRKWNAPMTMIANMLMTNTAIGSIRSRADSAIPNRLTNVRTTSPTSETSSRWSASAGKALPTAAAPAARLTATVST